MIATPDYLRQKAHAVIVGRFDEIRQRNAIARAVELERKDRLRGLSAPEQAELDAIAAVWSWVRAVRAASNAYEARLAKGEPLPIHTLTWPAFPG